MDRYIRIHPYDSYFEDDFGAGPGKLSSTALTRLKYFDDDGKVSSRSGRACEDLSKPLR
ncbi:predicted protein [Sclerotinia sclerotiorum 1980 UF-70]|uniref:Uncharacterized protein n=1 Tax=Sclerotinia sclerotiorum (strain ATCC 18683 / 1980 / Ss-1) TaxID=665079 RepID=A7EBA2_SCLS1|nr:predicted protein [Sclerotinia sclerotiorum 1980 UF-70]EDN99730.1 predicted protein [Sclerotinia sclerotiorum 1980 UF-70]